MKLTRIGWISLVAALIGTAAAQAPEEPVTAPSTQPTPAQPTPAQPTPAQPNSAQPAPMEPAPAEPQQNGTPQNGTMKAPPSTAMATHDPTVLRDIETTMGFVPQWLRSIPPALLPGFWQGLKSLQMSSETKLDMKTKELIGLAVAAQIPCDYCVMFHTQAARMNGATDQEIQEAVGMAAITREASTLLNGLMIDKAQFKKDLDRMSRGRAQARK